MKWPWKKEEKESASETLNPDCSTTVRTGTETITFDPEYDRLPHFRLRCGACVCYLNRDSAEDLSISRYDLDLKLFREGDAVLLCTNDCEALNVCPLFKGILAARKASELEALVQPLIAKGDFVYGKIHLAGIDDAELARPDRPFAYLVKALIVRKNCRNRVIVPPMLADLGDGEDSSSGRDKRPDGGKSGEDK